MEPPSGIDGAFDRVLKFGSKPSQLPAIFIHAGAGFHSQQNERVHLEACVAAAEMGMKFLKAGGSATEAVEASLRVLEDKEITNAGYGSNLTAHGAVECDATIVDHLGRSGACGAVPNVRNPISLAKLILDETHKPLSLRRVPPNVLVGWGAREWALEHDMFTFPNEQLISRNARDRWARWQEDLRQVSHRNAQIARPANVAPSLDHLEKHDVASSLHPADTFSGDHTAAITSATWNEGQTDSPGVGTPNSEHSAAGYSPNMPASLKNIGAAQATVHRSSVKATVDHLDSSPSPSPSRRSQSRGPPSTRRIVAGNYSGSLDRTRRAQDILRHRPEQEEEDEGYRDVQASMSNSPGPRGDQTGKDTDISNIASPHKRTWDAANDGLAGNGSSSKRACPPDTEPDVITDTIGAIAIDSMGHIAAGSSSGGIGMKHMGRLGPAALVGIGTAIVPASEEDEDSMSVAVVTSGTGEHMATTMASQRCAERIYKGNRRGPKNTDVPEDDEDVILESFIADDFMNHPGVRNYHSAGAIGVMVVKKSRAGYYFYFAHNTDSFALASMGGNEKEASCVMSRLSKGAKVARGGRKVRTS